MRDNLKRDVSVDERHVIQLLKVLLYLSSARAVVISCVLFSPTLTPRGRLSLSSSHHFPLSETHKLELEIIRALSVHSNDASNASASGNHVIIVTRVYIYIHTHTHILSFSYTFLRQLSLPITRSTAVEKEKLF